MKKALFLITCILILGITLQSCRDNKIREEVNKLLQEEFSSIHASVRNGVVTLEGTAQTEEEKYGAEGEISGIVGVKSIINNVVVQEPLIPSKEIDREANIEARTDAIINEEK